MIQTESQAGGPCPVQPHLSPPVKSCVKISFAIALAISLAAQAADVVPLGKTLKLSGVYAEADGNPVYDLIPITVECRAKLSAKTGVNVIISNGLRISIRHWEIFAAKDSGHFAAF